MLARATLLLVQASPAFVDTSTRYFTEQPIDEHFPSDQPSRISVNFGRCGFGSFVAILSDGAVARKVAYLDIDEILQAIDLGIIGFDH